MDFTMEEARLKEFIDEQLQKRDELISSLHGQIDKLVKRTTALENKQLELEFLFGLVQRRIDDQDQYARRLNLVVRGVPTSVKVDTKIKILIAEDIEKQELDIDQLEISRAHRHGIPYHDNNGVLQQDVLVRFISWRARNIYYMNRKGSQYKLIANLTERRAKILSHAITRMNDESVKDVIDFVFVDKNCRLTAKSGDKFFGFSAILEFETLINFIEGNNNQTKTILLGVDSAGISNMEPAMGVHCRH